MNWNTGAPESGYKQVYDYLRNESTRTVALADPIKDSPQSIFGYLGMEADPWQVRALTSKQKTKSQYDGGGS